VLLPVAVTVFLACLVLTGPVSLLLRGRWRPVRLSAFLVLYLVAEAVALSAALAQWLRGRTGLESRSYTQIAALLGFLCGAAVPLFRLRVEVTGGVPAGAVDRDDRALVVLARHAGPGDSFLLVYAALVHAHLRPRIVLKQALRLDPCLDVLLGRVPHCFVARSAAPHETADAIRELGAGMQAGDAMVIFPEGGNFTERRRQRSIRWLRRHGRSREADRTARMHHVLPPRTEGTLAALAALPGADVVFVAHTGLDDIVSLSSLWRGIPLARTVRATWWRVHAEDVPSDAESQTRWLLDEWARIDSWIAGHTEDVG